MNIKTLMKQAQTMQQKMQEMQMQIAEQEFKGQSGGGLVSVIMRGNGIMSKVTVDPTLLKVEEKEMLEDLLVAAYNEAKSKIDVNSKSNMSGAFSFLDGMPIGTNSRY